MTKRNRNIIAQFKINNRNSQIITTKHANERMSERNVDAFHVVSAITSIGTSNLNILNQSNDEAMVIDEDNNLGVVFAIRNNIITVITVIKKNNIFVKDNTELYTI